MDTWNSFLSPCGRRESCRESGDPWGGYLPGREIDEITVGDILRAVEGSMELVDCVTSSGCPVRDTCISRHTWSELYEEISGCIDSITLKDLAAAFKSMDQIEYAI